MLSVEECRKYLKAKNLSDEQVITIRKCLYKLAHNAIDGVVNRK